MTTAPSNVSAITSTSTRSPITSTFPPSTTGRSSTFNATTESSTPDLADNLLTNEQYEEEDYTLNITNSVKFQRIENDYVIPLVAGLSIFALIGIVCLVLIWKYCERKEDDEMKLKTMTNTAAKANEMILKSRTDPLPPIGIRKTEIVNNEGNNGGNPQQQHVPLRRPKIGSSSSNPSAAAEKRVNFDTTGSGNSNNNPPPLPLENSSSPPHPLATNNNNNIPQRRITDEQSTADHQQLSPSFPKALTNVPELVRRPTEDQEAVTRRPPNYNRRPLPPL